MRNKNSVNIYCAPIMYLYDKVYMIHTDVLVTQCLNVGQELLSWEWPKIN